MQKTTIDKQSNLNTEAKTSSQDYNKSQPFEDKKNGISTHILGKTQPIKEEKRVKNFVEHIQKYYVQNSPGNLKVDPAAPKLKKLATEQNETNDQSNRVLSQSNDIDKLGSSALRCGPSKGKISNENSKVKASEISQNNPFASNKPKPYPQSRVKIFVEKQKSGSESPRSKLKPPTEERSGNSSRDKIMPEESGIRQTNKSEESDFDFKPPPMIDVQQHQLSDSFDFKPAPSNLNLHKKSSMDLDSDEDISNLYDRGQTDKSKLGSAKQKGNLNPKIGFSMVALQKILEASNIYKDYLKKGHNHKKPSIVLTELDLVEKSKLPQQFFFKPERVAFNKIKQDLPHEYNYNGYHILCKVNQERSKFYFQDLKMDQLKNLKGIKCSEISIPKQLKINKNVEYDHENKRFYLFSNAQQKIYVYSQASGQLLCQISVKKKVFQPHLFLHQISGRIFLLIIGGYTKVEKNVVQGSKFIQIFELKKWEIELKSQVIKLSIGRISPIIMTVNEKNQTKILILGGNTIATIDKSDNLDFDYEHQTNQSTNLTGTSILSQQIVQLFDYEQPALTSLHPIKISHSTILHDGCVIPIHNTYLLLLPKCKRLIQIKIMNKEIIVIEGKHYNYIPNMSQLQKREVCLHMGQHGIVLYKISQNGIFQMISQENKTPDTCFCSIY